MNKVPSTVRTSLTDGYKALHKDEAVQKLEPFQLREEQIDKAKPSQLLAEGFRRLLEQDQKESTGD